MVMKLLKSNNFRFGLLIGLLGLLLGLLIIYLVRSPFQSFGEFLTYFFSENQLLTSVGSLTLLGNIALFTVYVNTNRDKTAAGIFTISVIYGIAILLLKVV